MLRMELLKNIASSPDPLHQVDLVYKRPLVYSKMETLIKEMQDEETAFAGYDIIEWLMERLTIEDSVEAIHLANLLCQHGYFFPVSTNATANPSFSVKDDSSLYRFQTPYYWPNRTSLSPYSVDTSVDYAIYLSKRTLRHKQKHALEEYELDAYSDLKRCLGNRWDFVVMQADEQVRLSKDRKKHDKLVQDSQEKAYWRVVRPPPGSTCCIETSPTYSIQSSSKIIRKTNNILLEDLRNEVELLRNSCIRTRIKASGALESLSSHCEAYHEHDPFLVQRQPSNPWVSDDPTYWILNGDVVEIPTERRLKKWAISMEDLIFDVTGCREFTSYLKKEYCHENIRFWLAVREMKFGPVSLLRARAQEIFDEFLSPGSPCEINIDMRTMEAVQKELNFLVPSRFTFDPAAEHVYVLLLKKDCYPRFIRSEHYKNLVVQSQQMGLKNASKRLDKFFSFVADRKKKTSAAEDPNKKIPSDHSNSQQIENMSSLADNIPYRGDFDINQQHLSAQNSLDDVCCPWETSSSVKSDKTSSTGRIHRIEQIKQIPLPLSFKSEKPTEIKQKSLDGSIKSKSSEATNQPAAVSTSSAPFKKESSSEKGEDASTSSSSFVGEAIKKQLSKQSSNTSGKSLGTSATVAVVAAAAAAISAPSIPAVMYSSSSPDPSGACFSRATVEAADVKVSTISIDSTTAATTNLSIAPIAVQEKTESEELLYPYPVFDDNPQPSTSQQALLRFKLQERELKESKELLERKQFSRKKSTTSSTSSAEICPWDCENGSAPEQSTFTKTYSTLGYL